MISPSLTPSSPPISRLPHVSFGPPQNILLATANLVAGISFLVLIGLIFIVAWHFGLGAQIKEFQAAKKAAMMAADADGDGKVSLEEILGCTLCSALHLVLPCGFDRKLAVPVAIICAHTQPSRAAQ